MAAIALAAVSLTLAAAGCGKKGGTGPEACDNEGGRLVAFSSDRGHPGQYDLYLYDADLGGFRLLKNLNSPTASDSSPSLSSDGQVIAFVSARDSGGTDIYVYERISCSFVDAPLLRSRGDETDPAFSGDTRRLAFTRDTLGHKRIRLFDGASQRFVALPGLDGPAPYDDWSPTPDRYGENLVFVSNREGGPHLYLYHRGTGSVDSLTALRAGGSELEPSMTPDGRYLAFASDRPGGLGGFDIYDWDFTSHALIPLPLLNTSGNERHPSISPSGNTIAFQSDSTSVGGWDIRYYGISGAQLLHPDDLARSTNDIHPSARFE